MGRMRYVVGLSRKWVSRISRLMVYVSLSWSLMFFFAPEFKKAMHFLSKLFSDLNRSILVLPVVIPRLLPQNYVIALTFLIGLLGMESREKGAISMLELPGEEVGCQVSGLRNNGLNNPLSREWAEYFCISTVLVNHKIHLNT